MHICIQSSKKMRICIWAAQKPLTANQFGMMALIGAAHTISASVIIGALLDAR
jgi:hypothetical protein